MANLRLWRYSRITGLWVYCRNVTPENQLSWLAVYEQDEPDETFRVGRHKPTDQPIRRPADTEDRSFHVARATP